MTTSPRSGRALMLLVAAAIGVGACGSSGPSAAVQAARQTYLTQVLDAVPSISQVRSNSQLVNLGNAVCSGFASGESYPTLAERMALDDGEMTTSELGTVITAAAEDLCPKYSSKVS